MSKSAYEYTKISELKEGDRDVNIYGVVKFFRRPKQTATNDWNGIYTIVDSDDWNCEIRCNLFGNSEEKLPQVSSVGDIVRFHRMFIKSFRGRLQMQGSKRYSSWLVFHKDRDMKPVSSHPNFTMTDIDIQYLNNGLRRLSTQIQNDYNDDNVAITTQQDSIRISVTQDDNISSFITIQDEDNCISVTDPDPAIIKKNIASILVRENENILNKFKIKGKLVAIKPLNIADFVVVVCVDCFNVDRNSNTQGMQLRPCKHCKADLKRIFFIEFLIEDETGMLHVELVDEDAVYFLNGVTPNEFPMETLTKKFDSLYKEIEKAKNIDSLPSIELYVNRFCTENDGIRYRVFGSRMV